MPIFQVVITKPAPSGEQEQFVRAKRAKEKAPDLKTGIDPQALKVDASRLSSMGVFDITKEQWEQITLALNNTANKLYQKSFFSNLYLSQQMESLRQVISPFENDNEWNLGLKYDKSGSTKKAAETLSDGKGKCDDFTLLYLACVNKLVSENGLKIEGIHLTEVRWFDPKKNEIEAHSNIVHISRSKAGDDKSAIQSFLVDFTYRTKRTSLDLPPEEISPENPVLKKKMVSHLNGNRTGDELIKPENVEILFHSGFAGGEAYYHQTRGDYYNYEWRKTKDPNYRENSIFEYNKTIEIGAENGFDVSYAHVQLAGLYLLLSRDFSSESENLRLIPENLRTSAETESLKNNCRLALNFITLFFKEFELAANSPDASAYVLKCCADMLASFRVSSDLPKIEDLTSRAIKKMPYSPELYVLLGETQLKQNKISDAKGSFSKANDLLRVSNGLTKEQTDKIALRVVKGFEEINKK